MHNYPRVLILLNFLRSALILLSCLLLGKGLSWLLGGLLPASILGMLLLTIFLATGLVKIEWVELSANLLLRWLSLLFVPISVALISQFAILARYGLHILFILFVSTVLVMLVAGWAWQWLEKPKC